MGKSIGIIETHGMVAAYEGVDVALKTSSVVVVSKQLVDAGLVTITIEGDIASVTVAVEAAVSSVKRMGRPVVGHVIPNLSYEVLDIIEWEQLKCKPQEINPNSCEKMEDEKNLIQTSSVLKKYNEVSEFAENDDMNFDRAQVKRKSNINENSEIELKIKSTPFINFDEQKYAVFEANEIDKLKVAQLRKLVRELKINSIDRSRIKFANKMQLIDAIRKHMRGGDSS